MSIFRVLNLRYLRRQPLRAFLAIASIAACVGGSVGGIILVASLDRSLVESIRDASGPAPLRIAGPLTRGGVDGSVVDRVAALDGVEAAVPIVQAVVVAQRAGGDPVYMVALGVDCRVEAFVGTFGCTDRALKARRDGPVLTSAALVDLVGRDAEIRTDHGRVPIEGAVINDSLDGFNSGRVAIFDLATAQRLFDRGRTVDAVYVKPARGVDVAAMRSRLERAVGPTYFVLGRDELAPWMANRGPLIPLLGLGLLISLALSGLLVYNILSLSLADRRRDLAVASAIGTSPRSLASGVIGEAALLGLIGGILGIPAGIVAARPLVTSFASVISTQATGIVVQMSIPWIAYLAAVLIGSSVGAIAAIVPARRSRRLDLSAELHGRAGIAEEAPRRSFVRVAVLLVCGAVAMGLSAISTRNGALEVWQPPLGAFSLVACAIFVFAAVGAIAPMVLSRLLPIFRNSGGPLRIAVANLVSRPRRTSVIATAVGAAVGLACVLGALIPATRATIAKSELMGSTADVSIATLPLNNSSNVDARPSRELLAKLERIPGVAQVDGAYSQEITDEHGVYSVRSFEGVEEWTFQPVMGEADQSALDRGDVVIGTSLARARNLRPGSLLRVATPTGFVPLRVAGIWVNSYDNGYNAMVSPARFERMFGRPAPHYVTVTAGGVTPEVLARRIEHARIDPDMTVRTRIQARDALADEIAEQASPFWFLQRTLLLVALVGTLSTLLLVGVQRRRELGVLGAVGFGPLALGRMTLTEALSAALVGSALGTIGSLATFEVLRNASAVSIGVRTEFGFSPLSGVSATLLAAVVVIAGAALPAWRAARMQIVEAIRDE